METPDPKYKHKPSEKHTLEEVLKTLQDLIRNDLSESTAGTNKPGALAVETRQPGVASPKTPESRQRRESLPNMREDFAPVSPGSGPVNLNAVMRSLKDLIGNELDVGDAPKPVSKKSASTHDEYLSAEEKIEEYIPEDLARLDDELNVPDEHVADRTESTPPSEELSVPEELNEKNLSEEFIPLDEELTFETPLEPTPTLAAPSETLELPGEISLEMDQGTGESTLEEFTPLDEELTFEEPLQPEPSPAALSESTELPGEISPELLGEPESSLPVAVTPLAAPAEALAPGTQHELFFEEVPRHAPKSEAAKTDSTPATATEPAPTSEPEASADKREQPMEANQESATEALPTIEVEESFDDHDYFAAIPSDETPPSTSEETIVLDAEISPEPEIVAPPVAETAAPSEPPEITATPAEPSKGKITLEIMSETAHEKPRNEYSVDFDLSDLTPPLPEEPELASPEASTETKSEAPIETIVSDKAPLPESEVAAPSLEPPAVETKTETPAKTEPPRQSTETVASEASVSPDLDDIPVLNEVVAPPAGSIPTARPTASFPEPPLPAPDRARDIVVRAVAKLNVEMRKSGGAGLDTRTILRLQQLIRQELEKGGEK